MYFDYSATTPMCKEAIEGYVDACLKFPGNYNSKHTVGEKIREQVMMDMQAILDILKIRMHKLLFTSGASESNQRIIETVLNKPKTQHVLMSPFEHNSIVLPLAKLQRQGLEVQLLEINKDGTINLKKMKQSIRDNTALIIVAGVDSELGIIQPIDDIVALKKTIPLFSDMTQAIGKQTFNLNNVDYISFSAHKFYGPKGLGGLLYKENIFIRNGTMPHELIHSARKALETTITKDPSHVKRLNGMIVKALESYNNIHINTTDKSVPHILNISLLNQKGMDIVQIFSDKHMYVSKSTACSNQDYSRNVFALSHDMHIASTTMRISLSHITTQKEINALIEAIKEVIA